MMQGLLYSVAPVGGKDPRPEWPRVRAAHGNVIPWQPQIRRYTGTWMEKRPSVLRQVCRERLAGLQGAGGVSKTPCTSPP